MTQKTINCAECGVQVTYNEKEGFPRKYCFNCSAAKKASFKHASESKPTHTPEGEPIVYETPGYPKDIVAKKKDNGIHLTIETVRSNALTSAIEWCEGINDIDIIKEAKIFEQYILTGE